MDERKKILLGNKDLLSREIEDFYININLSRDNKEVIPYKYNNVFDLDRFYDQERNGSRNFIIYGTIDSYFCDCDELIITAYQSPEFNLQNQLCSVYTEHIVNENMEFRNIYNKIRGKYIIDNIPTTFTGCSVYLKIEEKDPLLRIKPKHIECIVEQQLIYTTLTRSLTGEKIVEQLKYGLNEAVTDCDGNVIEVINDFDFFYNKHWIKKNIYILDESKEWIGNEDTKYCETTNALFRGRNVGIYNTGNYAFGETIEVYQINNDVKTGNATANTIDSEYYIAPIPSLGACPIPAEYTFDYEFSFIPASGNIITTAPYDTWFDLTVVPNDTLFMAGEQISGTNLNTSSYWSFLGYAKNSNQVNITTNDFKFNISQNTVLKVIMQEIAPYSIAYTSEFFSCSGDLLNNPSTQLIVKTPDKNKFYDGENVDVKILQKVVSATSSSSSLVFRLTEMSVNGENIEVNPLLNETSIALTMNESKGLYLKYEQGVLLSIKQKYNSSVGNPSYEENPVITFISTNNESVVFDGGDTTSSKIIGCGTQISMIVCTPGTAIQIGSGYLINSTGWKVDEVKVNNSPITIFQSDLVTGNRGFTAFNLFGGAIIDMTEDKEIEITWSRN